MPMSLPDGTHARPLGRVSLVGAGPGDPELLTLKAARIIAEADLILHDKLVGPEILLMASSGARLVDVGKRCGRHSMKQAEISRLLVAHARAGAYVVRLKGGDPFVFGRGGEELDAVRSAGIPCDIVPGVTAACAAAARLAIPLTQRGVGRSVHFVSGHEADAVDPDYDWSALARRGATLVVYMGARRVGVITAGMVGSGIAPTRPAVAIENATLPGERVLAGSVGTIADLIEAANFVGPTLVIFGDVAARASREYDPAAANVRLNYFNEKEISIVREEVYASRRRGTSLKPAL